MKRVGMELGWGGFDRAKLDMLILIRIPFSFHVLNTCCHQCQWVPMGLSGCLGHNSEHIVAVT